MVNYMDQFHQKIFQIILTKKKIDIKPSNINLHSAIKKVGIYNINIKFMQKLLVT